MKIKFKRETFDIFDNTKHRLNDTINIGINPKTKRVRWIHLLDIGGKNGNEEFKGTGDCVYVYRDTQAELGDSRAIIFYNDVLDPIYLKKLYDKCN